MTLIDERNKLLDELKKREHELSEELEDLETEADIALQFAEYETLYDLGERIIAIEQELKELAEIIDAADNEKAPLS